MTSSVRAQTHQSQAVRIFGPDSKFISDLMVENDVLVEDQMEFGLGNASKPSGEDDDRLHAEENEKCHTT